MKKLKILKVVVLNIRLLNSLNSK